MDKTTDTRAQRFATRRADQSANLFARLQTAATRSRNNATRYLKAGGGLSINEWRILWDLHEAGPLSIQELADIQRADHSLISRTVPDMRAKGLVKTVRSSEDKRQSLVHLDAAGERAFQIAAPFMQARRKALAETFTADEIAQFLSLIERFENYLAQPVATPVSDAETE